MLACVFQTRVTLLNSSCSGTMEHLLITYMYLERKQKRLLGKNVLPPLIRLCSKHIQHDISADITLVFILNVGYIQFNCYNLDMMFTSANSC